MRRTVALLAGLSLLAGLFTLAAPSAGAAIPDATVVGGRTTVVVTPTTARALVGGGILPLPVAPGTERPVLRPAPTVVASFPVTGGSVDPATLTGTIDHAGGLRFVNLANHDTVAAEDFTIVLGSSSFLTAYLPALGVRATLFDLGLGAARVSEGDGGVTISGIAATLDPGAAAVLDSALGTTVFTPNLPIGTAATTLVTG